MKVFYWIAYGLAYLTSLLPLRLHYFFADVLVFPLVFHILKYRRALVQRNLRDCFPEKSEQERQEIERKFYHWLADYMVETLKEFSISRREMMRRMEFVNLAEVEAEMERSPEQHCFLYLGHFCNWEWVASLPLWSHRSTMFGQIYHPLHSPMMDRLFFHIRGRFGATNIAMKETLRVLLHWKREGHSSMVGFIADQAPKIEAMHHWTEFLHHDTSFFTGAEKIGGKLGARFFYLEMTRPRRGYYRAKLREMHPEAPTPEQPFPVTDAFARCIEQSIRSQPHLWLWTHNRWKRTRQDWENYKAGPPARKS